MTQNWRALHRQIVESFYLWKFSKPVWTWPWTTCSSWPCCELGGWDDFQRSLPAPPTSTFCDYLSLFQWEHWFVMTDQICLTYSYQEKEVLKSLTAALNMTFFFLIFTILTSTLFLLFFVIWREALVLYQQTMSIKDNLLMNKRKKVQTIYFPFVGAVSKFLKEIKP